MVNGKPGDDPILDLTVHGLPVYSDTSTHSSVRCGPCAGRASETNSGRCFPLRRSSTRRGSRSCTWASRTSGAACSARRETGVGKDRRVRNSPRDGSPCRPRPHGPEEDRTEPTGPSPTPPGRSTSVRSRHPEPCRRLSLFGFSTPASRAALSSAVLGHHGGTPQRANASSRRRVDAAYVVGSDSSGHRMLGPTRGSRNCRSAGVRDRSAASGSRTSENTRPARPHVGSEPTTRTSAS